MTTVLEILCKFRWHTCVWLSYFQQGMTEKVIFKTKYWTLMYFECLCNTYQSPPKISLCFMLFFKTIRKQNKSLSITIIWFTMYSVCIHFTTNLGVRAMEKNTIITKPYIWYFKEYFWNHKHTALSLILKFNEMYCKIHIFMIFPPHIYFFVLLLVLFS